MKKILAFSGSNSSTSINRQLLLFATKKMETDSVEYVNLNDYNVAIFSEDLEKKFGIPAEITQLHELFSTADGFMISIPEHNGLLPAFFKNIIDWLSRIDQNIFNQKPVILLSTSPGQNGGQSNLKILQDLFPRWGAEVIGAFSLGNFYENFDSELGAIKNNDFGNRLDVVISDFEKAINLTVPEFI